MNRRQQNRALKDWAELVSAVDLLGPLVAPVLARGTYDSGQHKMPERGGPESGTPPPSYADPTGEIAVRESKDDAVHKHIVAMARNIALALNIAKAVMAITPENVAERAKRSVPNCAACGDLITGKIFFSRWDNKCRTRFRRWVEDGNAADEKLRFEQIVQNEQKDVHPR